MNITNNIPNTTFKSETDPFSDTFTLTVTCSDGYVFDGTPKFTYEPSDPFSDDVEENLTVSEDKKTATLDIDSTELGDTGTLTGSTKTESEPVPETVNNIPNTTYKTTVDTFSDVTTVAITCADGYVFDGVPTVKYVNTSNVQTIVSAVVGSDKTTADAEIEDAKYIVSLDGSTKEKTVEPTVTNNVDDSTETHTFDGSTLTVSLSSKKVMVDVKCSYTSTDGSEKNVSVPVTVDVKYNTDVDPVTSTGSVSITDFDISKPVTLTGTTKQAIAIQYVISGCTPVEKPTYAFIGEPITITLNADEGNEFANVEKNYMQAEDIISAAPKVIMTVSDDKKTVTGTYTPVIDSSQQRSDEQLDVYAEATQIVSPTKKYGFINAYVLNEQNLEDFATKRFVPYSGSDPSYSDDPITYDLGDYVNRVKRFFFDVEKGSTSKLYCGNFVVDTDVYNLASDTKVIDFGSIAIPNVTGTTADYDTDLNLFVPFIGLESLPSDLIGETVQLQMKVNLLNGSGVYVLTCDDRIVWTQEVEPSTDVLFRTSKQEVRTVGSNKFDSTYLMGLEPYLILQKKTIVSTDVETGVTRSMKVSDVTGNVKMTNVHFADTSNMLMADVENIKQILRNGFTL